MFSKFIRILFLIILFSVPFIFNACVDEQIIEGSDEPEKGNIHIQSEPPGAEIFFLGSNTGKITPDSLTAIDKGTYEITLKHKNFFDSTFTVAVLSNFRTTKYVILKSVIGTGSIFLSSQPTGAGIYVNGNFSSKSTPDTLEGLAEGAYQITLKLSDYYDTTLNMTVSRDKVSSRNVTLTKKPVIPPPRSAILVSSNPSGARIFLGSTNTGKVTPDSITNLDAGSYSITLKLSDYRDTTVSVSVGTGQTAAKDVTLTKIVVPPPPKVNITLASVPSGASIFMNGSNTGKVTPGSFSNLDPGNYSFTLKLSGYLDTTFTINAGTAGSYEKTVTLSKIPEKKNSISVESIPPGAQIYLNGSNTGQLTPSVLTDLSDGTYSITLKHNGFNDTTVNVTVIGGENKSVSIKMKDNLPEPKVELEHQVTFLGQLLVTFSFDQDVLLENVAVTNPNDETSNVGYGGQKIDKGDKRTILILISIDGTWKFKFTGKNAGGTQNDFSISESIKVND